MSRPCPHSSYASAFPPHGAPIDSGAVTYVYAFDHKHRRPPMEHEGPPRRQGCQPRRDDQRAAPAGAAAGSRSPPTPAAPTCRRLAEGLDGEIAAQVAKLEKQMGRQLGDPADPLLVSVRSGAKFSMPGMMDTVLNLGLNDKSVKGLAAVDRRRALRLRLATAGSSRCTAGSCSTSTATLFEHPFEEAKRTAGVDERRRARRRGAEGAVRRRTRQVVKAETGKAVPAGPDQAAARRGRGRVPSWNGARAIAYRVRERISHDLGTAVNVQAMVFGNRDDNSGTGVGFTRNAATGENKPYGDFLINAQGEDVVAGIRNTEDLDALETPLPDDPRRAARRSSTASSATTRTCATPSSPSSRASSGCSRPASASAPAPPL